VTPGAEVRRLALGDDVALGWSAVRLADGSILVGTGNDGKVLRVHGDDVSVWAETGQLVVTALAVGEGGKVYAGTLPEGRIYVIEGQGQVTELVKPDDAAHVWSLAYDARRHTLFAATGPSGKLFAIDAQGRAEVYWDSEAAHVMSLALDTDGSLYAGTSDDAIVVKLAGPGRAEVVYDFPGNEITAIAARGGALADVANELSEPPSGAAPPATTPAATKAPSGGSRPRAGKGRLWRVDADRRAENVFAQDDGHFTSVELGDDGTIYAGAGKDGRIYRVSRGDASSTWIDVDERQVLAIGLLGDDPWFVTGDGAALYRVVGGVPANAIWNSKVLDARFLARFGTLTWRGSQALEVQTRSGNTEEPNESWSQWSQPMRDPGPIRSPAARFLQIRARFPRDASATLLAMTAYYLPQNQRGRIRDVRVKVDEERTKAKNRSADDPPSPSHDLGLEWTVDNPDDDRVRYRLRYRAEGQTLWRPMMREHEELTKNQYTWDTSAVPDGYYVVEVEGSDELSNPEGATLVARAESEPLLVDNHPPRMESIRVTGTRVVGRVIDGLGPIAKLEYAVDGQEFRMFFPTDDLFDTRDERFDLDLARLDPGEHIVAVRAYDAAGNSVSAEVTLRR
jgi:hypothetical protein